jgi:hypothetical protein
VDEGVSGRVWGEWWDEAVDKIEVEDGVVLAKGKGGGDRVGVAVVAWRGGVLGDYCACAYEGDLYEI